MFWHSGAGGFAGEVMAERWDGDRAARGIFWGGGAGGAVLRGTALGVVGAELLH